MQAHNLGIVSKTKTKKRVGRGGKRGTYSGRGIKGQKARSGRRIRPQFRDTLKKIPKKRGYSVKVLARRIAVVNLKDLEKKFENNSEISPKALREKGLISKIAGRIPEVKILGEGELAKSFIVRDCVFSKKAEEALIKSGSRIFPKK
ncbi:50S ribosomal protein L15 [Candidatus Giovannonibacteria bacterium]|nr:50S ribosomal protein L15 [Candidatus Giovannonibacteria bacterium]